MSQQTAENSISLREYFDQRFERLERRLDRLADQLNPAMKEIEDRVEVLERRMWVVWGVGSLLVMGIVGLAWKFLEVKAGL